MKEHSKQRTIAEAIRLGRMITTHDRGALSLETCIDSTVAEVARRTRVFLLLELADECNATGRTNAARWLLAKAQAENETGAAERRQDILLCQLEARGAKGGQA